MNKIMIFTNEVNDGVEDDVYIKYDNDNDKNFDGNFFDDDDDDDDKNFDDDLYFCMSWWQPR